MVKDRWTIFWNGSNSHTVKYCKIMSSSGTPAHFNKTKKNIRLFDFLMASIIWLFHSKLLETVSPKILTLSTTESSFPLTTIGLRTWLFLLKSIIISLHLAAFSCRCGYRAINLQQPYNGALDITVTIPWYSFSNRGFVHIFPSTYIMNSEIIDH